MPEGCQFGESEVFAILSFPVSVPHEDKAHPAKERVEQLSTEGIFIGDVLILPRQPREGYLGSMDQFLQIVRRDEHALLQWVADGNGPAEGDAFPIIFEPAESDLPETVELFHSQDS
jgi:hypothetical protein